MSFNNLLFQIRTFTWKIVKDASRKLLQAIIRIWFPLYKISLFLRRLVNNASHISISLYSLVVAVLLFLPSSQTSISNYQNIDTIFITIGSTLITILVLAFTLAIIPIQRAVESFSPSVSYVYRNDGLTKFIFILVSLFALVSFVLAIESIFFGIRTSILFPIDIFVVGVTLDLLRWFYRRICELLEPAVAIQKLSKLTTNYIKSTQRRISRYAKLGFHLLPDSEKEGKKLTTLETSFYLSNPRHEEFVTNNVGELAQIANKAISKNEIHTANTAISSLADICIHYLESRKNNLILYPSKDALFLVNQSDIDAALNKIYQNLSDVAQNAIRTSDQTSCIYVLRAFGKIAIHISNLKSEDNIYRSKDLLFAPVSFLGNLMEKAQADRLDEVVLQGCYILEDLSINSPKEIPFVSVDLSNSDLFLRLIKNFLISDHLELLNKVMESMFRHLFILLEHRYQSLVHVLISDLKVIENLLPLALAREKLNNLSFAFLPFSMPYQITNDKSLAAFVLSATSLNKVDANKKWVNPYHDFSQYNDHIARHFRQVAEKSDLGRSAFLWYITSSLKTILVIYLQIFENPLTNVHNHLEYLVKDMTLYMSFFWVAFSKSTKIKHYYAIEACDALAYIALSCYSEKINKAKSFVLLKTEIIKSCLSNIVSIVDSYSELGDDRNPYNIADLLMYLWHIRLLAIKQDELYHVTNIDSRIRKLKIHVADSWSNIEEAFELRHRQLIEELFDNSRLSISDQDKTVGLLRYFLTDRKFLEEQSPKDIEPKESTQGKTPVK